MADIILTERIRRVRNADRCIYQRSLVAKNEAESHFLQDERQERKENDQTNNEEG